MLFWFTMESALTAMRRNVNKLKLKVLNKNCKNLFDKKKCICTIILFQGRLLCLKQTVE